MSRLVETIRTEAGNLLNISFHNDRVARSLHDVFSFKSEIKLERVITVPENAASGVFKCRVEYDHEIRKIEFIPYEIKPVRSLRIIVDNEIEYRYKFVNRSAIEKLTEMRGKCDDIIIVKNGYITDSSYANLIFLNLSGRWITPSSFLLSGTRRASMLKNGLIQESPIPLVELKNYIGVKLINAMIGIDDTEMIPIANIFR